MLKAVTESDLIRLRRFLCRLEGDALISDDDISLNIREISRLKNEISYLEAFRSRAFLLQIPIDYGARG